MLGDASTATCRSYGYDLLRWHRVLWALDVGWEQVTEAETAALVGWLRHARNPQRERQRPGSHPAGSVNPKTGKPTLRAGYAPSTIAHNLTVVHGFSGRGYVAVFDEDVMVLPRLDEIEEDLLARRKRAAAEGWQGEIEGIDLTLNFLRSKREQTSRFQRVGTVDLGLPHPRAPLTPE